MLDSKAHDYAFIMSKDGNFNRSAQAEEEETSSPFAINIVPNPNDGLFNIVVENTGDEVFVEVYDLVGKMVLNASSLDSRLTIDIKDNPKGVYMVLVKVGDQTHMEKVVLQ